MTPDETSEAVAYLMEVFGCKLTPAQINGWRATLARWDFAGAKLAIFHAWQDSAGRTPIPAKVIARLRQTCPAADPFALPERTHGRIGFHEQPGGSMAVARCIEPGPAPTNAGKWQRLFYRTDRPLPDPARQLQDAAAQARRMGEIYGGTWEVWQPRDWEEIIAWAYEARLNLPLPVRAKKPTGQRPRPVLPHNVKPISRLLQNRGDNA